MLDQDKHMQWGRLAGLLLVLQLLCGVAINFFFYGPLFSGQGFMLNGAEHANMVGFGALFSLDVSSVLLLITLFSFRVFKEAQLEIALALLVFASLALAATIIESITMMNLISYSEAYVAGDADHKAALEAGRVMVASLRNWAHYMALVLSGSAFFVFYMMLLCGRFVPRFMAWFGMVAAFLQILAVAAPFIGLDVNFLMMAPLALANLGHGLWLMAKGYGKA